jgi:polar amino acid transport system permease protein
MILDSVKFILLGTGITLAVTAIALPLGFVVGLPLALLRVYGGSVISRLVTLYSTVMRGVPPIVLLFLLFFVIAGSINLSPFLAGSFALGIISSGYQLEIFRGGIQSVGSDQMMAARSVGMTKNKSVRFIILPQALRVAIPSWSNEAATVIKDSSLVYAIGVAEILRRAQYVSARTYQPFIAFSVVAIIYFIMTFVANRFLTVLENRTRIPAA